MKLRYLLMSAVVLTSTAGATMGAIGVSADSANYADATHATTQGNITFKEDNTPVNPVDPDDPNIPITPVDPINPNGAELMITYASNINFGEQSKLGTSWDAYADKIKDSTDDSATKDIVPFVSVKDSRGTDRDGWKLTVKQDGDFKNGTDVLKGAVLKFSDLHYAAGDTLPTATAGDITLGTDAAVIASADSTHGSGISSLALGTLKGETEKDSEGNDIEVQKTPGINLSIPSGTAITTGTYTTSLTYELTAGVS